MRNKTLASGACSSMIKVLGWHLQGLELDLQTLEKEEFSPDKLLAIKTKLQHILILTTSPSLRQGLTMYPWLSWCLLCRPGWAQTQICLPSLPNARIKGVSHTTLYLPSLILIVSSHSPLSLYLLSKIKGP